MKKLLVMAAIALGLSQVQAQETSFGLTAGLNTMVIRNSVNVLGNTASASNSATGFYAGVFADFEVSEKFHIQPELLYSTAYKDGNSTNTLNLPILAKYYVADQFSIHAGPTLDYVLDESNGLNKFGFGVAAGLGYDFSDKVFATARYSLGLSNRIDNPIASSKFDYLNVGIGFRF
ncbi:conserved exported hypothetical protein [Tenacibaculum litopenaei]|uniref:porin family protein n=1 Tax=Tenacibaculum litopenaei TaxID=396016 RepID=UPI003894143B